MANETQVTTCDILKAMPQDRIRNSIQSVGGHIEKGCGILEMAVSPDVIMDQMVKPDKYITILYVVERESYEQTRDKLKEAQV